VGLVEAVVFWVLWIALTSKSLGTEVANAVQIPLRSFGETAVSSVTDKATFHDFMEGDFYPLIYSAVDYNGKHIQHPNLTIKFEVQSVPALGKCAGDDGSTSAYATYPGCQNTQKAILTPVSPDKVAVSTFFVEIERWRDILHEFKAAAATMADFLTWFEGRGCEVAFMTTWREFLLLQRIEPFLPSVASVASVASALLSALPRATWCQTAPILEISAWG
jgi:hypothetical protein